jgi:hypothetical protein
MFHVEHSTSPVGPAVCLGALLVACGGEPAGGGGGLDSGIGLPELGLELSAEWDVAAAEAALGELMAGGLPFAQPVVETYLQLREEGGDGACPGEGSGMTTSADAACTSDAGFVFFGTAELQDMGSDPVPAFHLFATASIGGPEGEAFEGAGQARQVGSVLGDGAVRVETELNGSFRGSPGPPWLEDGVSSVLKLIVEARGVVVSVVAQGGFSRGSHSVVFDDLMIAPDHCGGEGMDGALSLRDPSGLWFRWQPTACTDCGPLLLDGDALEAGEDLCLDAVPLAVSLAGKLGL